MYHLSDRDIIGLCYRTLDESSMTSAAAHLAWCVQCRQHAEVFGQSFNILSRWEVKEPSRELITQAALEAVERWGELRPAPKTMRAAGVLRGDRFRGVRLMLTLSVLLMLGAVAAGLGWVSISKKWYVKSQLNINVASTLL